jgi:hypothetical protein
LSEPSEIEMRPILREIRDLNQEFPVGLIAIGGVAVYMHTLRDGRERFAESTHDIDFYLSKENLGSLRDREELTANPKLHKQQIVRQAIEMDIYVEHQHRLAVPYEDLDRYSTIIDEVRVAAKEHLLALKIDAAIDRFGSTKGEKDGKDLVNLVVSLDQPRIELLRPILDEERLDFLRTLGRGSEPFQTMSGGNSHQSSILRKTYKDRLARIERALAFTERSIVRPAPTVSKAIDEPKRTRVKRR